MSEHDRFYGADEGASVPDSESLIDEYEALYGGTEKKTSPTDGGQEAPSQAYSDFFDRPTFDFGAAPEFTPPEPPTFDFGTTPPPSSEHIPTEAEGAAYEETPTEPVKEESSFDPFDIGGTGSDTPPEEQYAHSKGEKSYRKKEKEKKKFREGFRIFRKGAKDSPIYEAQESDSEGESPMGDFTPDENEDVFTAAERSHKKKKGGAFHRDARSAENLSRKAKAKKDDEVISSVRALGKSLTKKAKTKRLQIILLSVLTFVSLVLYILPSFYVASNPLEAVFANGGKVYGIINILLLVLIAAAGYDRFTNGLKSFGTLRFIGNTGLVILFVLVLVHDGYTMLKGVCGLGGNDLYTVYAAFAFLVSVIGEWLRTKICLGNLTVVAQGAVMDSINSVEDEADAKVLAKGIFGSEDKLLYCAGAEVIKNLREDMGLRREEKGFYPASYTLVLVAAVVCGIILGLRNGSAYTVTGLVACACLCAPTVCDFTRTLLLYMKNRQLNSQGGAVLDFSGTEQMGKAKGIVMDASDIFVAEVLDYVTAKLLFVTKTEVPVLAAALLKYSGSMLFPAFFYRAEKEPLPLAENVEYIPRGGFRGKVGTHTVVVGNRRLAQDSGAEVLSEKNEAKKSRGKALYYIVIDGHTSAYFVVNYEVRNSIKADSAAFNRTGLMLFLSSKEPFLGEGYVAEKMRIDGHCIKLISGDGRGIMEEYRRNKSMRALSTLVCARRKKFIFNLAVWAQRFYDADRLVFGANVIGQFLFFVLIIAATFMDIALIYSPITIIFLHCLWGSLSVLLGQLKK